MSLKHGILGLLNYNPMTGYELDKRFKHSFNYFWKANRSQIYRELNTMKKLNWVKSETIIQTDKPNKKLFSITELGKDEFINWLSRGVLDEELQARNAPLMKMYFASNVDPQVCIENLISYKEKYQQELNRLNELYVFFNDASLAKKYKKDYIYWRSTIKHGKAYYAMCIKWAEDTINELEVSLNENSSN